MGALKGNNLVDKKAFNAWLGRLSNELIGPQMSGIKQGMNGVDDTFWKGTRKYDRGNRK